MVSRFSSALSVFLISANAFAIGELPTVNSGRIVSVRDLYGIPPKEQAVTTSKLAKNSTELLIPNKPNDDLWTNKNSEPPLRMPEKSEITVMKSNFSLPEESLADNGYIASNIEQKNNNIVTEDNVIEDPTPAISQVSTIRSVPRFAATRKTIVPEPKVQAAFNAVPDDEYENDNRFATNDEEPLTKLSPTELKRAFKKTFTIENKHLSTYQIDDGFDEASSEESVAGFDSSQGLSEKSGGVRPLEIKIAFNDDDSALSRDNYNLLTEYAGIVSTNPKRAVQISISERTTRSYDGRKLAARRLAIIEQVLKDSGILDRRIIPVLSQRSDDAFVLRIISSDTFNTLSEKKRDMFGDTVTSKTYKSMSW